MGKRAIIISAACVAGLAAGGVAVAGRDNGQSPAATADAPPGIDRERSYASVEQRNLVRSEDLDGVVSHGDQRPLRLTGEGTITGLPTVDDVIEFGQPIAEVNGEPVVLLEGDRPAWRPLASGMSKGEDIRQLEAALVEMGYADPEKVTVDDTWTAATTAAVKAMQKLLGMPDDGRLDLGEVVFETHVGRVSAIAGELGGPASAAGIEVTGLDQAVEVSLASSKFDLVQAGDPVDVELPSGETVSGVVESVGRPLVAADGSVTYPVAITTEQLDLADGVPVQITVNVVAVQDAVAVPAESLLALAEGGYAVEVPDESSATGTRLVGVDVGAFADGWVQVTGEVAPGDQVVVP